MSESHPISINAPNPQLRALLAGTDVDPPIQLWDRIVAARGKQIRQRRQRVLTAAGMALAASIFAAVVLPGLLGRSTANQTPTDWKFAAQELELRLQNLDGTPLHRDTSLPEQADLETLDQALQAAYDRAASDSEIMSLWQRRYALLNTLLAIRSQPLAITRI